MKKLISIFAVIILLSAGYAIVTQKQIVEPYDYDYLSPTSIIADEAAGRLYIAQSTAKRISVFDTKTDKVIRDIHLPVFASGLVLSKDKRVLYVTESGADGKLLAVNKASGEIQWSMILNHTPVSPVLSADGKIMYVCNRFSNNVSVIDLKAKRAVHTIAVAREPVDSAVSKDGKTLFVVNHLPDGAGNNDNVAAKVSVIDTKSNKVIKFIKMHKGVTNQKEICLSPDGKWAYVTHMLSRNQLPTTQLDRGWMNTNAVSIIDVAAKSLYNTVLLDDIDWGAANPFSAACTADGKYLCVTCSGTHEIVVIDRIAMHVNLAKVAAGDRVSNSYSAKDVPNDLDFLEKIKKRHRLKGNGPGSMVIVGNIAYATEYFSGSLAKLEIAMDYSVDSTSIPLGKEKPVSIERRGEMLFNDASICYQNWQSCASCHPGARAGGVNWDLLNDGIGNPKSTKSLLHSHVTPPVMITGVRPDAADAVRKKIRYQLFAIWPEEDAIAIDEYLKSLKPVASPYLVKGELSKSAKRGKKLFDTAKCGSCHSGPMYTDMKLHDVGTGVKREKGKKFDTPTLAEVWRTGPFLNDGRGADIQEIFKKYNAGDMHGTTTGMTEKELDDLAEYVLSL